MHNTNENRTAQSEVSLALELPAEWEQVLVGGCGVDVELTNIRATVSVYIHYILSRVCLGALRALH